MLSSFLKRHFVLQAAYGCSVRTAQTQRPVGEHFLGSGRDEGLQNNKPLLVTFPWSKTSYRMNLCIKSKVLFMGGIILREKHSEPSYIFEEILLYCTSVYVTYFVISSHYLETLFEVQNLDIQYLVSSWLEPGYLPTLVKQRDCRALGWSRLTSIQVYSWAHHWLKEKTQTSRFVFPRIVH